MSTGGVRGLAEKLSLPSPLPLLLTYILLADWRGKTAIATMSTLPVVKMGRFALLGEEVQHLCIFGRGGAYRPCTTQRTELGGLT